MCAFLLYLRITCILRTSTSKTTKLRYTTSCTFQTRYIMLQSKRMMYHTNIYYLYSYTTSHSFSTTTLANHTRSPHNFPHLRYSKHSTSLLTPHPLSTLILSLYTTLIIPHTTPKSLPHHFPYCTPPSMLNSPIPILHFPRPTPSSLCKSMPCKSSCFSP